MSARSTPSRDASDTEAIARTETVALDGSERSRERAERGPGAEVGASFGRYCVLSEIGTGAMGIVFAAFDPDLGRKVALKVMQYGGSGSAAESGGAPRLLREAQAMARLAHPNVVTVYDVGTLDGQVFIAMELIEGQTLRAWLASEHRSWPRVLEALTQAGRGLAAAHAASLVHRDFKPENVLVGDDGRVRVTDFGLARPSDPLDGSSERLPATETEMRLDPTDGASMLATPVTETGVVLGTPAYMAPEQHDGLPTDARSDQFGFCVTAYEALTGHRPFDGRTVGDLALDKRTGRIREAPAARVPARALDAIRRGLARTPEDRWPAMHELLRELEAAARSRRRAWFGVAGLGASLLAIAASAPFATSSPTACDGGDERLVGIWDDDRRDAIAAAFSGAGVAYADGSSTTVASTLDRYAEAWVAALADTCRNTQGPELDRRVACLNVRRSELAALVDVLSTADAKVVRRSVRAVAALRPIQGCSAADAVDPIVALPADPEPAARVVALRERLARVRSYGLSGRHEQGAAEAEAVLAEARSLDYSPLAAEALLQLGGISVQRASYEAAQEAFAEAHWLATSERHDFVAAEAATRLVYLLGIRLQRTEQAMEWAQHARAAVARIGHESLTEASLLSNLAGIANQQGRFEEGQQQLERAIEIRHTIVGPDDPLSAALLDNVAVGLTEQGRWGDALGYSERALATLEQALGPDHPEVGTTHSNVGSILSELRKFERARTHYERALAVRERTVGREHPGYASVLLNLGTLAYSQNQLTSARKLFDQALAILEKSLDPNHPHIAVTLLNLAYVLADEDDHRGALALHRRALTIHERSLGRDDPMLAHALTGIGNAKLELGDPNAAMTPLERALSLREPIDGDPTGLAETRFALARALWSSTQADRSRAQHLAQQARQDFARAGHSRDEGRREVERWLAEHEP